MSVPFEEVAKRVFRFKEAKPSYETWPDQRDPGHERGLFKYIGDSGGVEGDVPAAIPAENFTVGVVVMPPGNRPPRHTHTTEEVFIPLSGKWEVELGENGEYKIPLEQWDCISVPAGVIRSFVNVGNEDGYMMAIMGKATNVITVTEKK